MVSWRELGLTVCLAACASVDDAPQASDDSASPVRVDTAPDPCAALTWETVGQPFLWTWCTPCHSAALPGRQRSGAPAEVDLDTLGDALAWSDRIRARALGAAPTMPPAAPPEEALRDRVEAWLSCEEARR